MAVGKDVTEKEGIERGSNIIFHIIFRLLGREEYQEGKGAEILWKKIKNLKKNLVDVCIFHI